MVSYHLSKKRVPESGEGKVLLEIAIDF